MHKMGHYACGARVSGRHRGRGLTKRARAAVVVLVVLAGAGAFGLWRFGGSVTSCAGEVKLTLAAAPEIATPLRESAALWARGAHGGGGECVAVEVNAVRSADMALAVADAGGVVLTGLTPLVRAGGAAPMPRVAVPDVWVPDSSAWLVRVRGAGSGLVPPQAPSIATSPVVLAMPEPLAGTVGWPSAEVTWSGLLQRLAPGSGMRIGIVEPNRDAAGLSGLVALDGAAAATGAAADQATVAVMRALFQNQFADTGQLLNRFPKSSAPEVLGATLAAAPLPEYLLLGYNAGAPAVRLAAVHVTPAPIALDYPYAVLPGIAADRVRLADELRYHLAGEDFRARLSTANLRGPDGTAHFAAPAGTPLTTAPGHVDGAALNQTLSTWISVTRPARMLAIIDVSGSMAQSVSAAAGTRMDVAIEAARQGLALFDDSWQVGLWIFSTRLSGDKDYRELLPITSMAVQKRALEAALGTIKPVPNGGTGLYDTVLAAYRTVQTNWDPAFVNSIVLLTDGRDEDRNSIGLDALLDQLQTIRDDQRPVQVIAIGIGDEVSQEELERITNTTGGGTFIARDPSAIGAIFAKALLLRPAT